MAGKAKAILLKSKKHRREQIIEMLRQFQCGPIGSGWLKSSLKLSPVFGL